MTDAVTLIRTKRDGHRLSDDDIRWLFEAYARGEVADEQMSALLMAIYFQGLDGAELRTWTAAMIASGDRLDLSSIPRPTVDKHSTGGVGDKVSLILAPLVAACGAAVPQLSGRGLGHTGGTLDKLESIPGWRAVLSVPEMMSVLAGTGCVICAAGPGIAPAGSVTPSACETDARSAREPSRSRRCTRPAVGHRRRRGRGHRPVVA